MIHAQCIPSRPGPRCAVVGLETWSPVVFARSIKLLSGLLLVGLRNGGPNLVVVNFLVTSLDLMLE